MPGLTQTEGLTDAQREILSPVRAFADESLLTYVLVVEEIARGWRSISGIVHTHRIVAYLIGRHGTQEQKAAFLPPLATGEIRAAFSVSGPGPGFNVTVPEKLARRATRGSTPPSCSRTSAGSRPPGSSASGPARFSSR